jgi:hypothetical protein
MSHIIGTLLFVAGVAMVFFAMPKGKSTSWAMRIAFFGELYIVAAISLVVLGICVAVLS